MTVRTPILPRARKISKLCAYLHFPDEVKEELNQRVQAGKESWKELAAWLKSIGHPWSDRGLSEYYSRERATVRDQVEKIAKRTATTKLFLEAARANGMEPDEQATLDLTEKLSSLLDGAEAPETPAGRDLILKAAPHVLGVRTLNLKRQLAERALEMQQKELDQRQATKIDAGLEQIEREVGKNPKVKEALDAIRLAMQEAA